VNLEGPFNLCAAALCCLDLDAIRSENRFEIPNRVRPFSVVQDTTSMCSGPNAVNERVEHEFTDLVCKRCRQHTITIRPLVHDWLINSWGRGSSNWACLLSCAWRRKLLATVEGRELKGSMDAIGDIAEFVDWFWRPETKQAESAVAILVLFELMADID
jgi:hypothetical protein